MQNCIGLSYLFTGLSIGCMRDPQSIQAPGEVNRGDDSSINIELQIRDGNRDDENRFKFVGKLGQGCSLTLLRESIVSDDNKAMCELIVTADHCASVGGKSTFVIYKPDGKTEEKVFNIVERFKPLAPNGALMTDLMVGMLAPVEIGKGESVREFLKLENADLPQWGSEPAPMINTKGTQVGFGLDEHDVFGIRRSTISTYIGKSKRSEMQALIGDSYLKFDVDVFIKNGDKEGTTCKGDSGGPTFIGGIDDVDAIHHGGNFIDLVAYVRTGHPTESSKDQGSINPFSNENTGDSPCSLPGIYGFDSLSRGCFDRGEGLVWTRPSPENAQLNGDFAKIDSLRQELNRQDHLVDKELQWRVPTPDELLTLRRFVKVQNKSYYAAKIVGFGESGASNVIWPLLEPHELNKLNIYPAIKRNASQTELHFVYLDWNSKNELYQTGLLTTFDEQTAGSCPLSLTALEVPLPPWLGWFQNTALKQAQAACRLPVPKTGIIK